MLGCFIVDIPATKLIGYMRHCVKTVQIRSFFLVRIFPHLDWIRRDTPYLSVFSPNAGKYGPGKFSYFDTFQAVREPFRIVYDDDISTFDQLLAMNKSFCIHHLNIEGHLIEIYKTLHEIIGNNLKEFTA